MLVDYLQKVYDMEKDKFLLLQLIQSEYNKINSIDAQIGSLKEKRNQSIVYEPMPKEVDPPKAKSYVAGFIGGLIPDAIIAVIATGILGGDLLLFIIIVSILLIISTLFGHSACKEDYEKYLNEIEQVKQKNKNIAIEYERTCQKFDNMVSDLDKIKKQCQSNINSLRGKCSEVENVLKKYYSLNILFNKYHHMEAVCKILEYLQSGRCNKLQGPSGAYDTYEKEYIGYGILDKLDKILVKMDEIQRTNVMLHRALQHVSNSVNQIHRSMSEQFKDLESHFEKSIGILEKNAEANRTLAEISNTNSRNIAELLEYQNFATKQQRLSEGHWT